MSDPVSTALKDPTHVNLDEERLHDLGTEAKRRAVTQGLSEEDTVKAIQEQGKEMEKRAKQADEAAKVAPPVEGKQ